MSLSTTYPKQSTFKRNAHINYFKRCLRALPTAAEGHDSNRITIAFFCLSALDLLGALEVEDGWVGWVWSLQSPTGGFRGSTFDPSSPGHLPSTYTAILVLALLRAPLDRLDIVGLERFLGSCRQGDLYSPLPGTGFDFQADVRMTYCACVIADMIRSDVCAGSERFLHDCQTWEGGYAAKAGNIEAQGGTTYCAIASLKLLKQPTDAPNVLRWASQRQIGGFQGRPGKLEDVCYSFWIGATIHMLGGEIKHEANRSFLLSAQSPIGGFGKDPDDMPDPYHSYLALAALAMSPGSELKSLNALWNVSDDTARWLRCELDRVLGDSNRSG